ncbi:uncharacterized protein AB675_2113 [Cyphellophora attinorum]|uniref:Tachykinin family protein n=1 Tax=Cyphellophora attinorum TaxID=1664694 RepID=A0A0N1P0R3_9EURO|nr:uncharacterized protein AB675_2113 [Phialophora attinorum]KPI42640.1 hypothetical protein AB675_2113 [Phialophora attinorum]
MATLVLTMTTPSRYEFIDYSDAASGRERLASNVRRRARVVVMDDFLRKQRQERNAPLNDAGKEATTPRPNPVVAPIAERKGRFRLKPLPQRRQAKPQNDGQPQGVPQTMNSDFVTLDGTDDGATAACSRTGTLLSDILVMPPAFRSTILGIQNPSPATQSLVHYYLQDYWTNSTAVNPDGVWTSITLTDMAMLHAKLSLVALHRLDRFAAASKSSDVQKGRQSSLDLRAAHLYHRGQAISLIQARLPHFNTSRDDDHRVTPAVSNECSNLIAAITLLTTLDDHSQWVGETGDRHMRALAAMVDAKGGMDGPWISDALRRVVGWVDLLRASIGESRPLLGSRILTTNHAGLDELSTEIGRASPDLKSPRKNTDHMPSWLRAMSSNATLRKLQDMLCRLTKLGQVKDGLRKVADMNTQKNRLLFSDAVYNLEYELAYIEDFAFNSDTSPEVTGSCWNGPFALRAFRDAAVVCSYAILREQNSRLIFGRLAWRIRGYVGLMLEYSGSIIGLDYLARPGDIALLSWVLAMGWKAALFAAKGIDEGDGVKKGGRKWFALRMAEVAALGRPLGLIAQEEDPMKRLMMEEYPASTASSMLLHSD